MIRQLVSFLDFYLEVIISKLHILFEWNMRSRLEQFRRPHPVPDILSGINSVLCRRSANANSAANNGGDNDRAIKEQILICIFHFISLPSLRRFCCDIFNRIYKV